MSDIKAGDLVIPVHSCCAHSSGWLGRIRTVGAIERGKSTCSYCGRAESNRIMAHIDDRSEYGWLPLSWLKRIDPPTETTEREEEICAH